MGSKLDIGVSPQYTKCTVINLRAMKISVSGRQAYWALVSKMVAERALRDIRL